MSDAQEKLSQLFEELVPVYGKANTVAGEIVRAINRIVYRYYNDGDHIGVGYGKETCNPPARYLMAKCDRDVSILIESMWGMTHDSLYNMSIELLCIEVLRFLNMHPELRCTENTEDMFHYMDYDEDVDDSYDDDDEYEEEYDDYEEYEYQERCEI